MEYKRKNIKKNQILDAALQVFVKKGYSETRMDDIVVGSGMSKGAIYHHYSSKRDLFLELIDFWEVYCFPNILDKKYENKTASGILREIVKDINKTFKEKKYVFLAELEIWSLSNHDDEVRKKTKLLYTNLLKLFSDIISHGIKNSEFKNVNINIAALSIMTSLQGVIWFSIFEKSELSAEEYLTEVMEFIIVGFKK
jgi:AcrR family transcriptional regulator